MQTVRASVPANVSSNSSGVWCQRLAQARCCPFGMNTQQPPCTVLCFLVAGPSGLTTEGDKPGHPAPCCLVRHVRKRHAWLWPQIILVGGAVLAELRLGSCLYLVAQASPTACTAAWWLQR